MEENKLDILLTKLSNIEIKLEQLEKDVQEIKEQTTKMDGHVDFVNNVYEKVEAPLHYITDKFHYMIGSSTSNNHNDNQPLLE